MARTPIDERVFLAQRKRYVFYKSLALESSTKYQNIYKYASRSIDKFSNLMAPDNKKATSHIKQALDFLSKSAAFERQKELQFFQHFESAYPEIKSTFNIKVNDILDNYPSFIANINRAIKGTQQFQKELTSEIERIRKNREASDKFHSSKSKLVQSLSKGDISQQQYEEDLKRDTETKNVITGMNNQRFFLTANGEAAFQAIFDKGRGRMSTLSELIIEKFGAKIFDKNLKLDLKQVNALIAAVTMKANELLVGNINFSSKSDIQILNAINSPELEKFIDNLLNSPVLSNVLNSLISQYHMTDGQIDQIKDNAASIKNYQDALRKAYEQLPREKKAKLSYEDWLKSIGMSKNKIKAMIAAAKTVSAQVYYVGEDLGMLDLVANRIRAVLGGGKNPTDDIEAGYLETTLNFDYKKLSELEDQLWKAQEEHFAQVSATTTYASFQRNTAQLLAARKKQQELIDNFKKENLKGEKALNELLSHINIHSTVKGYESAGSYAFEQNGGFGGAAFGATLDEELTIINSMITAGGLTPLDTDRLFSAMINCGKLMIGAELKPTIENYFSAFMGMLMFNDAEIFAQDVNAWVENSVVTTTVQDLHLYQLNGVVVPSSYILQKTYDAMTKLDSIDQKSQGIKAVFKTYNDPPIKGNWEATSAKAIEETKLERMHFLAGFIDLLESIDKAMPG